MVCLSGSLSNANHSTAAWMALARTEGPDGIIVRITPLFTKLDSLLWFFLSSYAYKCINILRKKRKGIYNLIVLYPWHLSRFLLLMLLKGKVLKHYYFNSFGWYSNISDINICMFLYSAFLAIKTYRVLICSYASPCFVSLNNVHFYISL